MADNGRFSVINIKRYFEEDTDPILNPEILNAIVSSFSCPRNHDVEGFLQNNAIEFAKKNQSVTYLVFENETSEFVAYFTLALKPLTVHGAAVSGTVRRKIQRISEYDDSTDTYNMSAYLIAQLGKNFTDGLDKHISGEELLSLALEQIRNIQFLAGGIILFLEANNEQKLISFYNENHFRQFDTRMSGGKSESHELIQFLKTL